MPRFAQNRHKKSAVIVVMREEAHAAIQLQFVVSRWRGEHLRTNLSSEDMCHIEYWGVGGSKIVHTTKNLVKKVFAQ